MRVMIMFLMMLVSLVGARTWCSSFESVSDFDGFYIVPQNHMGTASHNLVVDRKRSGLYSHKAWITGKNAVIEGVNTNHRGYPTIQFQKTDSGVLRCPCFSRLYVWLDAPLSATGTWMSLITLSQDSTDNWARTILANVGPDNILRLVHVPFQGWSGPYHYQSTRTFPFRRWVEVVIEVDNRPVVGGYGYAKLYQNGVLVSHAPIGDGNGIIAQAHFGLYADPNLGSGVIYNDDLCFQSQD